MLSRHSLFTGLSLVVVVALTFFATFAFAQSRPEQAGAQPPALAAAPMEVSANAAVSVPPFRPAPAAEGSAALLSPTLSYAFIPSDAFTTDANIGIVRQVVGCVNQVPLGVWLAAPVYLPQASQVVSITLFTSDAAITSTISTAYFVFNDGMGGASSTLLVDSLPNTSGYQQNTSTMNNPLTVNNQAFGLSVQWHLQGANPSPLLSLCGVRVAYYAPAGMTFLPLLSNPN